MKEKDYETPRSFFPIPMAFDMAGVDFISLTDLPSRDAESYGTQGSQAASHGRGAALHTELCRGHVNEYFCLLFHDGLGLLFV